LTAIIFPSAIVFKVDELIKFFPKRISSLESSDNKTHIPRSPHGINNSMDLVTDFASGATNVQLKVAVFGPLLEHVVVKTGESTESTFGASALATVNLQADALKTKVIELALLDSAIQRAAIENNNSRKVIKFRRCLRAPLMASPSRLFEEVGYKPKNI
jgi:hypothetical protein